MWTWTAKSKQKCSLHFQNEIWMHDIRIVLFRKFKIDKCVVYVNTLYEWVRERIFRSRKINVVFFLFLSSTVCSNLNTSNVFRSAKWTKKKTMLLKKLYRNFFGMYYKTEIKKKKFQWFQVSLHCAWAILSYIG